MVGAITTLGVRCVVQNLCARRGQEDILCCFCIWVEGMLERSREPSERRRAPCASPFRGAAAPQGRAAPLLFLALHR